MNDQNSSAQPTLDRAKIFVGGLSWQSTEETLRYHFEQYGEVVSVEVMRDRDTGNPRGFAFVVFRDDATVDLVMNNLPHEINHKIVDVKRAQARGTAPPSIHRHSNNTSSSSSISAGGVSGNHNHTNRNGHHHHMGNPVPEKEDSQIQANGGTVTGTTGSTTGSDGGAAAGSTRELTPEELQNKIFVGGLPVHVDNVSLKDFFIQFGNVTDAIVMMDVAQGRSRGFGFVTFEDGSGGAQKALASQPLYIDNKYVEIKLAQPKGSQNAGAEHGKKYVHQNAGLRNASLASLQSKGEFAGFAASYGRNGWKAGYGSYAFGKGGWAVADWETFLDLPEKHGFSFDRLFLLLQGEKESSSRSGSSSSQRKRDYYEVHKSEFQDKQNEHVSGGSHKRSRH